MKFIKHVALLAVCSSALSFAPAAQAGLIGLYQYNTPGNVGVDSSGNGNNLVASGGAMTGAGKYGGGLELNGFGALLFSPTGTLVGLPTGNSSYTIATWMNADTAGNGGAGGMVGWGNYQNTNQVNAFRMNGASSMHNYWWDNDLTGYTGNLTVGSGTNGWHFVAVTYDNVTNINAMYADGVLINSRIATGLNAQAMHFAIGKTVGTEYFDGQLDNTAIFDQALTSAQLSTISTGDFARFGVNNVPEPASVTLMLAGLGLVGAMTRRRKSA